MKGKWGMMMVDGRGKLGGHVLSKGRSGAIARTKVSGVNPQTSYQLAARAKLTTLSQGWRALTQPQRDAFNAAVPDFAKTDIFGDIRNPTGKNLYTKLGINALLAGQAVPTAPDSLQAVGNVLAGAVVMTDGGTKTVAFTTTDAPDNVQVWATAPMSPGREFLKGRYRLLSVVASPTSPLDISAAYEARFGEPTAGTRVGVKLVPASDTGLVGQASESTTITV